MLSFFTNLYHKIIIDYAKITLLVILGAFIFLSSYIPDFRLDASSDTLSLENDKSLEYYREIKKRYGSDDFLIITYAPKDDLFSLDTRRNINSLKKKLLKIDYVDDVLTMLDVPLVDSPAMTLTQIQKEVNSIENGADIDLARKELMTSPLYSNLIVNEEGRLTSIIVWLKDDGAVSALREKRNDLRALKRSGEITNTQLKELERVTLEYQDMFDAENARQESAIKKIRSELKAYKKEATIYLGGVPMIVVDSINYIDNDLKVFGVGVFAFLVVLLWVIFRRKRWVFIPMLTCAIVGIGSIGLLGFLNWPATIVSANFVALLLIFTLSFCVHQIVRFREYRVDNPAADEEELVKDMATKIGVPCFYMGITTVIAFGSLVISDIRPIIDFGHMMMMGIAFSFIVTFTFFPAALMQLAPADESHEFDFTDKVATFFSHLVLDRSKLVFALFAVGFIVCGWASTKLYVQNSFIDYYKDHTEIYKGMVTIDQKLGGTTPMDVIIKAPQDYIDFQEEERQLLAEYGYGDEEEADAGAQFSQGYWVSEDRFEQIASIHNYLESLDETGKVLSFHTAIEMLDVVMGEEEPLDRFVLGVVYNKAPQAFKETLLKPYISEDGNELRFGIRIYETQEGLNRDVLLKEIETHLVSQENLKKEQVNLTGMVVLYNNVLQTLFSSQLYTLALVFGVIFGVFWVLFKNVYMAVIALVPNVVVVLFVFGVMGFFQIPLDIMTITIAAICFGIANDDTIHFIHRFMAEFEKDHDYVEAVKRSHHTIGRAMYYTTITIGVGFSILALSNFVPTIYFGMLTALSLLVALIADMTLLPLLILKLKPFKVTK